MGNLKLEILDEIKKLMDDRLAGKLGKPKVAVTSVEIAKKPGSDELDELGSDNGDPLDPKQEGQMAFEDDGDEKLQPQIGMDDTHQGSQEGDEQISPEELRELEEKLKGLMGHHGV